MKNILILCFSIFSILMGFESKSQCIIYLNKGEKIFAHTYEIRSNNLIYSHAKTNKQLMVDLTTVYKVAYLNNGKYAEEMVSEDFRLKGRLPFIINKNKTQLYIYDAISPDALSVPGAQPNDVITHIDNFPIQSADTSPSWIYGRIGDYVDITLERNGKTLKARFYYYDYSIDNNEQITLNYSSDMYRDNKSNNTNSKGLGFKEKYKNEPNYKGFNVSFIYGVGGASFKGKSPLKFVYEFEIGYTNPFSNSSNNFKFGIHEYRRHNNEKMYAFNYRFLHYFSEVHRAGFNLGFDLGMIYVPNSNGFFWQPGVIMGYDFKVYRHIRLGLIGEVYLMPTYRFSNLAVGGYGGIKITGLL